MKTEIEQLYLFPLYFFEVSKLQPYRCNPALPFIDDLIRAYGDVNLGSPSLPRGNSVPTDKENE